MNRTVLTDVLLALALWAGPVSAADWPMFGRDYTRNAVSPEKDPPLDWDFETGRNIKWKAEIGWHTYATPVVANGLVWIGSNNGNPRETNYTKPAGVLMCFRESDGQFLFQHLSVPRPDPAFRWAEVGYTCSPLIEGDRLWTTTTRAEIICLDIAPLQKAHGKPELLWKLDMIKELGIYPAVGIMGGGQLCSIGAAYKEFIYVITSHGRHEAGWDKPSEAAPALVCLNRNTGQVVWEDESPGTNTLLGEWASPLAAEIKGQAQVIAPQGDGWLRSFHALTGRLLWKFDINPKSRQRRQGNKRYPAGAVEPSSFSAAPVLYENRIYIASGRYVEYGDGPGRLVCLDPTKSGDISLELEASPHQGEANPNSGAVWHSDEIGRTLSTVAIHDGLVIATELFGRVFCFDARTGRTFWHHDLRSQIIAAAPLIADGKVYVGDVDGNLWIFALAEEKKIIRERIPMPGSILSAPIHANGVLYLAAGDTLYAIQKK